MAQPYVADIAVCPVLLRYGRLAWARMAVARAAGAGTRYTGLGGRGGGRFSGVRFRAPMTAGALVPEAQRVQSRREFKAKQRLLAEPRCWDWSVPLHMVDGLCVCVRAAHLVRGPSCPCPSIICVSARSWSWPMRLGRRAEGIVI
ncbi:hypothetical protein BJ970_004965 [Saccharopolyspora phatthalungensis]|uniref:Uncharacterized protein n=1 Tax=Saccharopolyspora phatthalungensis TaxID=664693 RepID=A0A840QC78_9PSEU|nr:hypothetical protein [Saccharopolyspora phatthalungensis]